MSDMSLLQTKVFEQYHVRYEQDKQILITIFKILSNQINDYINDLDNFIGHIF